MNFKLFIRLIACILCSFLIMPLVACSGSGDTSTDTNEPNTADDTANTESSDTVTDAEDGEASSLGEGDSEPGSESDSDSHSDSDSESTADESSSDESSESESASESDEETTADESDITIVEGSGKAKVTTSSGLEYSVKGYDSLTGKRFKFSSKLSLDIIFESNPGFNRFTLGYSSTAPVKIFVEYVEKGRTKEDYYYLEKGEGSFSAVFSSFLNNRRANDINSITVEPCEDEEVAFLLTDLSVETVSVPGKSIQIVGERYTLGINLDWGGAIDYISDSKCTVDGVTNLINRHDTGRLVQQSYYGVVEVEGEYTPGSFNSSERWPYNPVQGGDKGNTSSRLIDLVIGNDSIYIKSQPMDWGKVNEITPSYMENTYTVEDDHILVNNRFVDFSGWVHPVNNQELPAFYTISYLDTFVYYDGTESWTGDDLTVVDDLPFWGQSSVGNLCSFRFKNDNSEVWSAFVCADGSYGIGLFVPNTDVLKAGRYLYDSAEGGSRDGDANPCGYIAPLNNIALVSYEALEYSYMITTGSIDEIRDTFTEHKDFTTNPGLDTKVNLRLYYYGKPMDELDFTVSGSEKLWLYAHNASARFDEKEGAVALTGNGTDPYLSLDFDAEARNYTPKD